MTADTWQQQAACKGLDPEVFFPERGDGAANAKAVCAQCPVTADCLMHAITSMELSGVWGGKNAKERRVIRRQLIAQGVIAPSDLDRHRPTACGTRSGYITHRTRGEEPCQDCRDANTEYQTEHKARTKDIECGTAAGYRRHHRDSEPPCQLCRNARATRVRIDRMGGAA